MMTTQQVQVRRCDVSDDVVAPRRNTNPKRANLVFCTTDKTNNPLTDQSVDYSVLSPCTNEALATTNESPDKAKPGRASETRQAEPSRATQSQAEPGTAR